MPNLLTIILVAAASILVIALLIWKNKKDKKTLNPDAPDAVEETMMDNDRRKDKL